MTYRNTYDYVFKVIVIGDSGVGKTNLILRFSDQAFKENYVATIGVDFKTKTIHVHDKRVKLQLWDTAGQQRFRTITETYYKGAAGIVLAYSINDRSSFENIGRWMRQIKEKTPPQVQKIIIGNKADLEGQDRVIERGEGEKLARELSDEHCSVSFLEVSAKTGHNVEEAFMRICEKIKEFRQFNQESQMSGKSSILKISAIQNPNPEKQKCFC